MLLSTSDKRRLFEDGYVIVPRAVPRERLDAALRAINGSLGARGLPLDQIPTMSARTFCPELVEAPEILDLYQKTALRVGAEETIGRVWPPSRGQIALRFPQTGAPRTATPHIDGMYTPQNGVPAGTLYHFTALGGVFLSDVTTPDAGNFTVWPGSHRKLEAYFRQHGPEALLSGMPPVDLGPPRPLMAQAGDAVVAHYALAHGVSGNVGPHIRYAVFFRLFHADHEQVQTACLTDLWREWEGMREVAPRP